MNDLQIILQSQTLISSFATATIISMALSAVLYNGYYSKIWRALAVIAGFSISVLILISGMETLGMEDFYLIMKIIILSFIVSAFGFWLGVFIYRREEKLANKKHGINCHLDHMKKELTESIKGCEIGGCKTE